MKFIKEVDSMDQKDVQTVSNPVYGDALKVHKQKQDNFKLVLDEVDDTSEDATIEEPKIEKRKEAKETGLQEKLLLEEDEVDSEYFSDKVLSGDNKAKDIFTSKREREDLTYYSGMYGDKRFSMSIVKDNYPLPQYRNVVQIRGIHPYDDAEYAWAKRKLNDTKWNIYKFGKRIDTINTDDVSTVLDKIIETDKETKPRMVHESKRISRNKMREDVEVVEASESETPQLGPDSILASMLNNLIVDEWNTIDAYNSALTYIEQVKQDDGTVYDYEGIKKILTDIVNEENVHVGQLQSAMQLLSPNTASIDKGTEEGDKQIAEGDSEDIMTEAVMDDPNAKEVLTKTAEGNVDKLIKQLEDAVTTTGSIKPGIEDADKAKEVNDEVSLKLLDMIDYLKSLTL